MNLNGPLIVKNLIMKSHLHRTGVHAFAFVLISTFNLQLSTALAQGTAFTYQGQLTAGGGPANGLYDFRFRLASDPFANNYVGSAYLTNGVGVSNGLFSVAVDFGPGVFTGTNYWLEVDVMTNGGSAYTELSPLQVVTPAPYALFAENVGVGGLAAGAYSNAVAFNNGSNQFSGTFNGDGAGLTNADAAMLGGLTATNFWQTSGNIGTSPTNGNFLGTADLQPIEIRVGGLRGWRVEPDPRGGGAASLIGGYISNSVQQPYSGADFIGSGGYSGGVNTILPETSGAFIGAGSANQIGPGINDGFIGAGYGNTVQSQESVIAGGEGGTIQSNAPESTITGGYANMIRGYAPYSMIGGGLYNQIYGDTNDYGTSAIGGGYYSTINSNSWNSFIGGGGGNTINVSSDHAVIAGGYENFASGSGVFIGGGGTDGTTIRGNQANGNASVVAGGLANTIESESPHSVIVGGATNTIQFYAADSTIVGGNGNVIAPDANDSFIGGGYDNNIATNGYATISGGYSNYTTGYASTVAGGYGNTAAGDYSFAGGNGAIAYGNRSFVWNSFPSSNYVTGSNEFYVFADNGFSVDYDNQLSTGNGDRWVYIGRGFGGGVFDRVSATISTWTGAYLSDGGTWTSSSDRARKENFAPVDSRSVLDKVAALPVQTWNYTNEPAGLRHMGPVAQDFHAAFGLNGPDDTHIAEVDEGGVVLAAIQGLNQKVEELKTELNRRDAENAELQQRMEALEQAILIKQNKLQGTQP